MSASLVRQKIKDQLANIKQFVMECLGRDRSQLWYETGLSRCEKLARAIRNWPVRYTELTVQDILECKTSDTLIILGSGASVNDITPAQWEYVSQHDSFGISFWIVHDFVPTFHHVEPVRTEQLVRHYAEVMKLHEAKYRNVPFFLAEGYARRVGWHPRYRPDVFPRGVALFLYPNPLPKRIPRERPIQATDFQDVTRELGERPYIARGSLSMVVHLGFQMGYKKIILVGVDLTNTRYFYDQMECMQWRVELNRHNTGPNNRHSTVSWDGGKFHAVDTFLPAFNEFVLQPSGVELFVANKSSLLYPALPFHPLA